MNRFCVYLTLILGIGLCALPARAQITVLATLDSSRFVIGDQWYLHLTVNLAPGTEIGTVDLSPFEASDNLEVIDEGDWQQLSDQGETVLQKDLLLTAWDSGFYYLPRLEVGYRLQSQTQAATTDLLPISVSTVPIPDTLQLAPIRPILREPMLLADYLMLILPVLAILLMAVLVWWAFIRKKPEPATAAPPPPPAPPHEVALGRLAVLRREKIWQQDRIKDYVSELTDTVRTYLAGRYDVAALESTSEEILRALQVENLTTTQRDQLREMLTVADLIKFAKARPADDFYERQLDNAEALVQATKRLPAPEPPQSTESA